jgi:GNAT superfamily N-acetyltransferase
MKNPRIVEESICILAEYSRIPISFEVRSILEVGLPQKGLKGLTLTERPVREPWTKDYDNQGDMGPTDWVKRWDISNWGVVSAFLGNRRVGGSVIAYDTPGVDMLEGRGDIAVLWDLRVNPDYRGKGIGAALVEAAAAWARQRGCRQLKAETQNINVAACRFYAGRGFSLGVVNRFAYREFPDEVQLVWYKDL